MIFIHHTSLSSLLPNLHGRLTKNDREFIRHYRQNLLNQICQSHHLPIPILNKDDKGKPYCANISHLHFNHSHSQSDYALVYSLTVQNIGVDIENIHRQVKFDDLARHCFHSDEYDNWQSHHCDKTLWFAYWTIKEAVLKASGIGIRMPLNELNAIFVNQDSGYVNHHHIGKFYFKQRIINDNIISIAYPFEYKDRPIIGYH